MNHALENEDKQYHIPRNILNLVNTQLLTGKQVSNTKQAKNLLNTRYLTYHTLKSLKHFFDTCNPQTQRDEYLMVGGDSMKKFVEDTLASERQRVDNTKKINTTSMPHSAMDNTLNLNQDVKMDVNESETTDLRPNGALAIIVNEEKKVLVAKRAPWKRSWMPNKYALVGGKIEKGEEPKKAAIREAEEEVGLVLTEIVGSFNVITKPKEIDHVFIAKAPKDQEVRLNKEHTEFKWVSLDEIKELDGVPHLYECVELALNKLSEKGIYN